MLKAAQVPLKGRIWPSGTTITVDDETFQSLSARGLIAEEVPGSPEDTSDPDTENVSEDTDVSGADNEPAEDTNQEPEGEQGPAATSNDDLPPMTAPLAVWREAADKLGIKTAGMKKPEIIGAVKAHLNK